MHASLSCVRMETNATDCMYVFGMDMMRSAADALRQVLRRVVHGVPRRGPLRRHRRLLHAPRRLRPGHRQ
jgi:hypothetical protein